MDLRIIATGGTFDKIYDPIGGKLDFKSSHLTEIIKTARIHGNVELEIIGLIDSLDMGDEQRMSILEACRHSREDRIVVVHGTDTMEMTGRLIGEASLDKCVVLTGAMVPFSVNQSDALFNLGSAVMAAGLKEYGTWIAMNGRVLRWDSVTKNRSMGIFVERENQN